ncbi:hypothetical protein PISL3812_04475 [Talaromyces islandicus]|uniref:Choline/carnitine acyltransferase domain-containing protein n=1 Tax=Talaromyces islandicus TaxID=28573 RepID=A0A0U1LVM3_TALIS|nr:hypothetical protein PISL3812_04475 [Talaromyces islandicus]
MRKMPPGDYVAGLSQGHLFKANLREGSDLVSYCKARNTFSAILELTDKVTDSLAGILTADDRDTWAETYIDMIEAATCVICLDDSEPNTPTDRMDAMMLNNGFNRWLDKYLEFIVCANGVSRLMTEHSLLDGMSIMQLDEAITAAILEHRPALPVADRVRRIRDWLIKVNDGVGQLQEDAKHDLYNGFSPDRQDEACTGFHIQTAVSEEFYNLSFIH